jgi:hypothetical protein
MGETQVRAAFSPVFFRSHNSLFKQSVSCVGDVKKKGVRAMEMEEDVQRLREWWLYHAAVFLTEMMEVWGVPCGSVRVSCGWPSSRGMSSQQATIGQCFPPQMCADGVPQIFVSPRIADSIQVLGVLLHELIHAAVGCEFGHGKEFSQVARRLGLEGKPTATTVGPQLHLALQEFVNARGRYPHATIAATKKEKKGSRLRLFECACDPALKVRVAHDEFRAICMDCEQAFHVVE